ncbi:MAG: hypothetical protein IJ335_00220 [Lachnospiraceae bacterium]|nr:hypothetical protein [Lachnospiraceae bacterium]
MQKKCKKFLLSGMVFALVLALTGCDIPEDMEGIPGLDINTEEQSTEAESTSPEEGDNGEDAETTTPETGESGEGGTPGGDQSGESGGNESQESQGGSNSGESDTDQKVEPAAAFDEEFVIKPGETLYIGTSEVCIKLIRLFYEEESEWTNFCYELKMGDTVYEGDGYWSTSMGGNVNQSEYTSNRVQVVSADKGNSVTFKITSAKEVKVPFVLSGNPEDEYITTQPEYIVSEDIILFLDEGVKVYGNTMELIETIRDLVEKETGLSMVNDTEYGQMRMSNMISLLYGQEIFAGVDHKKEKMHIYVVPYEKASAQGSHYYLVLNPKDLEIAAGQGDTLVHEMTHVIHLANGIELGRKLTEGYATYITGKIADRDEVIPFDFDSDFNYSFYEREITIENAEEIFAEEPADGWEDYPYGYRFMNFLFETYGEDIFRTLLADANVEFKEYYDMITNEKMVPIIKRNTEEEVFVKFAEWLTLNKDRFENSDNGEDSVNWEDCPTEPAAAFDQEFTLTPGEMLCIGSSEVCIWLDMLSYDEESKWAYFCYELKIGDMVYEGDGYWSASMGGNVNQSEYTPNRVQVVSADKGNSVTFKITSAKEVKVPLVLSGNPEDEYVTTQPEYIVSEDMILFLDEGMKIYGDTMKLIETIRDLVEKETGLSLVNDTEYGQMRTSNMLSLLYGQETFAGVDHKKEKMHIYVVPYEKASPQGSHFYLTLNPEDLEIAAGKGNVLVHEMTHVIHMANGIGLGRKLTEGYATYIAGKIADRNEVIPFNFDADYNYSYYQREITAENAEAIFAEEPEDGWENYLYGYRFMNFLFETYGEGIFRTLLADANVEFKEYYDMITNETLVPVIKRNTEEEVFVKFAEWLSQNKDRFGDAENSGSTENYPTEPVAAFDQEFTIKPGEVLCIGSPEICIKLLSLSYDEANDWADIIYELKIGDHIYTGSGSWSSSMGGNISQYEYTSNQVYIISADKGNSVTLKLTSAREIKSPIALSGNSEDVYVTTQPEYVISEDMVLFLDEGITVHGNAMELVKTIRSLVEKETGLFLVNDSKYGQIRNINMLSHLYGQEVFAGVDHKREKMHIFVVPTEKGTTYAGNYYLQLNPEDLEIAAGAGDALVHEMTQVIYSANGIDMGRKLTEGYAAYITGKIAEKDEVISFDFDANLKYSGYGREITGENAEAVFAEETWNAWEDYQYGYRFVNFLFETYGEGIFRTLLADANGEEDKYYFTNAEIIPIIKRNTEEEVFIKFADWLSLNKDRFMDN